MAEKIFYTMGEVAEMFDVNTSLIRHWESQFSILRPKRNKKGNRLFTPQDVEHLKMIYHLVKECGMTLEGAKKALRKGNAVTAVGRDTELMERLQRIRSLLVEVREELKAGVGELVEGGEALSGGEASERPAAELAAEPAAETPVRRRRARAVVKIDETPDAETAPESGPGAPESPEAVPGQPTRQSARKPRRKKEEVENKELFAFYEQSLF